MVAKNELRLILRLCDYSILRLRDHSITHRKNLKTFFKKILETIEFLLIAFLVNLNMFFSINKSWY